LGWGDEILAAGQAQRLYELYGTRVVIVDQQGRHRWHPIWDGNPIIVRPEEVNLGSATELLSAPNARPYIVYPFSEETGWTFNREFHCRDHVARIYLTERERAFGTDAQAMYGPYVLIEPYTKHENFRWSVDRWNALVKSMPKVTFVQHVHQDSPQLEGVVTQHATFRQACGLIASATAYVRSESGLCHAAAAFGIPQVTLFGGCMDADVMGGYPGQICIVDQGPGTPCGSWRFCPHCAEAMDRITVAQVKAALRQALGKVH